MPTTATGTAFTTRTVELGEHGQCFWTVRDDRYTASNVPAVLYAHGAGGDPDQFVSLSAWNQARDQVIDRGIAIIEGSGGRDTGRQNWGNAQARAAYPAYLDHVSSVMSIGKVAGIGRSMGNLVMAWLVARWEQRSRLSGWINNSGVSTLFAGKSPYDLVWNAETSVWEQPDALVRATAYHFGVELWNAYGVTVPNPTTLAGRQAAWDQIVVAAAGHSPEDWPAAVWDGVKVLSMWGSADPTVPPTPRGVEALRPRWAGRATIDRTFIRPGGVHAGTNTSYYDVAPFMAFLQEVLDLAPVAVPRVPVYRQVRRFALINGERRLIAATPLSGR